MHASHCNHLVRTIRRFVIGRETAVPEGELLQAFVDRRDEEAFAALVERHGPMVFGVCQGVLRNRHDAEDAFQATFLVLADKARSIRRHASLGSWLHGVAFRVARKALAASARRQTTAAKTNAPNSDTHAPVDDLSWREVHAILHEELAELREPLREPLVLCYLEGLTQDEAAGRLGWTATTVKGRLQRGRDLLRNRLERRGLGLAAALGTTMLAGQTLAAPVPAVLAIATVRAATSGAGAAAHTAVVALAREIVMTTGPVRIRAVVALFLLVVTLAGGMLLLPDSPARDDPPAQTRIQAAEPKPEPRLDNYGDPLPDGALTRLGSTRFRVGHFTNALAFAPEGGLLAAVGHRGYYDGCLWLFDAATGRTVHRVPASSWDWSMTISPDGKWLFTSHSLAVVEVATGKEVRRFAKLEKGSLTVVAFSPDGRTVAVGGGEASGAIIILWDVATGNEIRRLETPNAGATWSVAFAPDGKTLASGAADQSVRLWDVATGKELRRFAGHTQGLVRFVAFTPDKKLLVSAGEDWVIRLWDVETGQPVRHVKGDMAMMRVVALSPDGKLLASAGRIGTIHLWEVDTGKERCRWQAHRYDINSLAFSPDSQVLASAAQGDPAIRRWEMTGKEIDPVAGHTGRIDQLRFAAEGKTLWSSGWDSQVREWDLLTGRQRSRLFGGPMGPTVKGWGSRASDLAADGKLVALTGEWWTAASPAHDPVIRLCDTTTGKEIHALAGHGEKVRAESVQLSPDSKFMASAAAEDLRFWDVGAGKELYQTRGGAPLAFSPDSRLLTFVTRNADGGQRIHVWEVAARQELRSWNWDSPYGRLACLIFSPDGKAIAAASAGAARAGGTPGSDVRVWATDTGKEIVRAAGASTEGEMMIGALAFSPSGRMLAFGGSRQSKKADGMDGCTIQVLEVFSGKELRRFEAPQGAIWSLAFAPDGRTLASGGGDSTILLWDLTGRATDGKAKATLAPTASELDTFWSDLAGAPVQADRALWALVLAPNQSVPMLKERLRIAAAPPEQIAKLVAGLESDEFTVRESAAKELERFGASAEQTVRKLMKSDVTLEVRRRLEQYLERRDTEVLRTLRAVEALELIATPQARQVLETLAKEAANPQAAQAVAAALHRLEFVRR